MTALDEANGDTPAPERARVRIDLSDLNLDELGAIDKEIWDRLGGVTLDVALSDYRQKPALAIVAWMVLRRDNPDYTLEEAGKLRPLVDIELIGANPETLGGATGAGQPPSRESGALVRSM